MILGVDITDKSFGHHTLYHDLHFTVQANERVGLIGRNGTGKTTLFGMIAGDDKDYAGEITIKRGSILTSSRQEHHGYDHLPVVEYILADLPEYMDLKHIMDTYPAEMSESKRKMQD
jgi:ATP-binding cassette subfamily F protein 3